MSRPNTSVVPHGGQTGAPINQAVSPISHDTKSSFSGAYPPPSHTTDYIQPEVRSNSSANITEGEHLSIWISQSSYRWSLHKPFLTEMQCFIKCFAAVEHCNKSIANCTQEFRKEILKKDSCASASLEKTLKKASALFLTEDASNFVLLEPTEVNIYLKKLLPKEIKDYLTPLTIKNDELSFFRSVAKVSYNLNETAHLIRSAVIRKILDLKYSKGLIVNAELANLSTPQVPNEQVILRVCELMQKTIVTIKFGNDSELENIAAYQTGNQTCTSTIFVDRWDNTFFPLVPNNRHSSSDVLSVVAKFSPREGTRNLKLVKNFTACTSALDLLGMFSRLEKSFAYPSQDKVVYYKLNATRKIPFISDIQAMFYECSNCLNDGVHKCSATKVSYYRYLVVKQKFADKKFGSFSQRHLSLLSRKGITTKPLMLPPILEKSFVSISIEGDNNCAYSSVSFWLTLYVAYGKMLRRGSYLEYLYNDTLSAKIKQRAKNSISDVVKIIANDHTWIDEISMSILSNVVSRNIIVYQRKLNNYNEVGGTTYFCESSSVIEPIYLFLDNHHYVPLFKKYQQVVVPDATYITPELQNDEIYRLKKQDKLDYIRKSAGHSINQGAVVEIYTVSESSSEIDADHQYNIESKHFEKAPSKAPSMLQVLCEIALKDRKPSQNNSKTETEFGKTGFGFNGATATPLGNNSIRSENSCNEECMIDEAEVEFKKTDEVPNSEVCFAETTANNVYQCDANPDKQTSSPDKSASVETKLASSSQKAEESTANQDEPEFLKSMPERNSSQNESSFAVEKSYTAPRRGGFTKNIDVRYNSAIKTLLSKKGEGLARVISQSVASTKPWLEALRSINPMPSKKVDLVKLSKHLHQLQRRKPGRIQYLQHMISASLPESLINRYVEAADQKFGNIDLEASLATLLKNVRVKGNITQGHESRLDLMDGPKPDSIDQSRYNMESKSPMINTSESKSQEKETENSEHLGSVGEASNPKLQTSSKLYTIVEPVLENLTETISEISLASSSTTKSSGIYIEKLTRKDLESSNGKGDKLSDSGSNYSDNLSSVISSEATESETSEKVSGENKSFVPQPKSKKNKERTNSNLKGATKPGLDRSVSKNHDRVNLEKEAIAQILKCEVKDLTYKPPRQCFATIPAQSMDPKNTFSFDKTNPRMGVFKLKGEGGNYPRLIDLAIRSAGLLCSFNSVGSPQYYKRESNPFCKFRGKCGGDCSMKFEVYIHDPPKKGKAVKLDIRTYGLFHLVQQKPTGRQIRGTERERVRKMLETRHSYSVFVTRFSHLKGLSALHRNLPQKSADVLRKCRSEATTTKRLDADPEEDLDKLIKKYQEETKDATTVSGFIHKESISPTDFRIVLYDEASLMFHANQLKNGFVTVFLDASGNFVRKIKVPKNEAGKVETKTRQPLLYVLQGRNAQGITYPIGEQLSIRGRAEEICSFVKKIARDVAKIKPGVGKRFADMIVTDWSLALLNGLLEGINVQKTDAYIESCWDLLNGRKRWKREQSVLFICTNHLMKATERLVSSKLGNRVDDRRVLQMSLEAIARLQECFTLDEFENVSRVVCRVFGLQTRDPNKLEDDIKLLLSRKEELEVQIKNEANPEESPYDDMDETQLTQRNKSPFYQMFARIQHEEFSSEPQESEFPNKYYKPVVLDIIKNHKIPLWCFWAAAVPRAACAFTSDFLRESNASVENVFHLRKNLMDVPKNALYTDFIRSARTYHVGSIKIALDKILSHGGKIANLYRKQARKEKVEEEQWKLNKKSKKPHVSVRTSRLLNKDLKRNRAASTRKRKRSLSPRKKSATKHTPQNISRNSNTENSDSDFQKENRGDIKKSIRGLPNIGNSCYINSVMYSLLSLPFMENILLPAPLDKYYDCIFGVNEEIDTLKVCKQGRESLKNLLGIVDINHENSGETINKGQLENKENLLDLDQHDAAELLIKILRVKILKPVRRDFKCTFVQTLSCQDPKCAETRPSTMPRLTNFFIQPNTPLEQAIYSAWFQDEITECMCKSNNCQSDKMIRSTSVIQVPNTLLLVTNLWSADGSKVPYCQSSNPLADTIKLKYLYGDVYYRLDSFVTHLGETRSSGHYKAYFRKHGTWYECDDEAVTPCEPGNFDVSRNELVYFYFLTKL